MVCIWSSCVGRIGSGNVRKKDNTCGKKHFTLSYATCPGSLRGSKGCRDGFEFSYQGIKIMTKDMGTREHELHT